MAVGRVERHLLDQAGRHRAAVLVLVDSESSGEAKAAELAAESERLGAAAILVGGSSATDQIGMGRTVAAIKKRTRLPVVLFPGNVTGVVPQADAILFSSLMNSENPYFITQAQALGAPSVLKFGLETLPTAYLVIGEGTSAWFVGSARGIPHEKPKIAAAYALAAKFLGMRLVYLEAGSGAKKSVTAKMVKTVRAVFDGFIIVGGGIRDARTARALADAGADGLVIGTLLEGTGTAGLRRLSAITKALKGTGSRRV